MESATAGVAEHCRRVAAWADELALAMGFSLMDRQLVEESALLHHFPELLLEDTRRSKLCADLRLEERGEKALIPPEISRILQRFHGAHPESDQNLARLAAVVEMADDFDSFFEAEPFFESEPDLRPNSAIESMLSYLQVTSRADVHRVIDRLPVFPRAARNAIRLASNPEVSINDLEKVASCDAVLSGLLIRTANSALYSLKSPVSTVRRAIAYVGVDMARKIVLAEALRSNFASSRQHSIWNHSLDVAQVMEMLAFASRTEMEPAEAFLAGLVHDVGRLAFSIMPITFLERFDRLTSRGCPPMEVEVCLAGLCHGEAGSETLRQWKFPEPLIEAVQFQHRPERSESVLASMLYLAEFVSGSEEDLPSSVRLETACRRVGIDRDALSEVTIRNGYLDSVRFAA